MSEAHAHQNATETTFEPESGTHRVATPAKVLAGHAGNLASLADDIDEMANRFEISAKHDIAGEADWLRLRDLFGQLRYYIAAIRVDAKEPESAKPPIARPAEGAGPSLDMARALRREGLKHLDKAVVHL